jgi:hypothetical protein
MNRDSAIFWATILAALVGVLQLFRIQIGPGYALTFQSLLPVLISAVLYAIPVWAAWYFRRKGRRERADAEMNAEVEMLKVQAAGLLKEYRHLDHDHRAEVQLPLNNSSWPAYGSAFSYVHIQLLTLKSGLDLVIELGRAVWERHHLDARFIALFKLTNSVKMLDLLSALQEFTDTTAMRL